MRGSEHNGTAVMEPQLTPEDVETHLDEGCREIDILADGTLRESNGNGHLGDEQVTRTLKTERTWY